MKRSVLFLILFFTSLCCFAYHPNVRNFDKRLYKAGPQNWCMSQGSSGSLWVANTGVLEYDGSEWNFYSTHNLTSVRSLHYDNQTGRLYYGATNEFGYICPDAAKGMESVSLLDSMNVFTGEIWGIHQIGNVFWLRENNSIYRFDFQSIKQFNFGHNISCSAEIDGKLIIFTGNEGAFILSQDESFEKLRGTEMLCGMRVCSILQFGQEEMLFVTSTDGVFRYKDGILSEYRMDFSGRLKEANVFCAAYDGRYLAFGTVTDGVFIKDMQNGTSMHLNTFSGLQNNTVLSMFYDKDGNLWLGLDKGIDLVLLSNPEYRLFGNGDMFGAGYASAIYEDKIWFGTNQGLYKTDFPIGNDIFEDTAISPIEEIKGQVWSLQVHDNTLFCCHDSGIYLIDEEGTQHIPLQGTWKTERLAKNPDYILGSTYDRLFMLRKNGKKWEFAGYINGFKDASKAFEVDKDGRIWFGHWLKGLFRLTLDIDGRQITDVEFFDKNAGFPEDWSNTPIEVNGEILFSTARGFYSFDSYSGKAYPHEQLNSLFHAPPVGTSIFMTSGGEIYFSSPHNQGLYYKDGDSYILDTLTLKQVASKRPVGFEDIREISDNEIMINTEDGFSIIRTDMLKDMNKRAEVPEVFVKNVYVTSSQRDSSVFTSRRDSGSEAALRLPYKHNSLRFKAACPIYETDDAVQYSFMLENYDRDWSQYGNSNSKEYTRLPHGNYIFRVRAKDSMSARVSETSLQVIIDAPFYLSAPAYSAYLMLLILNIWGITIAVRRISLKRARQISLKNEEELKRKQMKADLEHKAQDLAASTMNVIRKNEILLDIDSNLVKVSEYIAEDRNKSLKLLTKIRHNIRENIQHDDVWQKFEKNFDIVYDDYLRRLGESYPHLTVSDKKMCAYLKMDLSSKEIAPLLNMTVRSVEMSRYRLRKKLGLSRENNLTEFLQKF